MATSMTQNQSGKRFFLYGEPQFWFRVLGGLSVGARMNIYYHINTTNDSWQVYPAAGIRWKL